MEVTFTSTYWNMSNSIVVFFSNNETAVEIPSKQLRATRSWGDLSTVHVTLRSLYSDFYRFSSFLVFNLCSDSSAEIISPKSDSSLARSNIRSAKVHRGSKRLYIKVSRVWSECLSGCYVAVKNLSESQKKVLQKAALCYNNLATMRRYFAPSRLGDLESWSVFWFTFWKNETMLWTGPW